jgi:hypothetical protein
LFPAYGVKNFNGNRMAFIGMTLEGAPSTVKRQTLPPKSLAHIHKSSGRNYDSNFPYPWIFNK